MSMRETPARCYACGAAIPPGPGMHYCGPCSARQHAEHAAERDAFEAFHAFADAIARGDDPWPPVPRLQGPRP